MTETGVQAAAKPELRDVGFADIKHSLAAGWRDYRRAPQYGLFFGGIFAVVGALLWHFGAGHLTWTLAIALGFPLAAPFCAVGLYEVSHRLETGAPLGWREILGVVWYERQRQVPWVGAIIIFLFMFWVFLGHAIFALGMGLSALTHISDGVEALFTARGLSVLAAELAIGAVYAFFIFSITVISLPLLLDRELDFVTAMLTSIELVKRSFVTLLTWAAIIAVGTLLAMLPSFMGLMIVTPILGHASWHFYKRAVQPAEAPLQ